ncbi:HAD-IA family hydrolase, partial [Amylibacter sp.]|nr:HAD-IA family hydrolase [Amylibacter sp.]
DKIISIDCIEIYKPDPKVYEMVLDQFNCKKEEVLFISSNGWDIAGASKFGFTTLWINRNLIPKDRLTFMPNKITNNLSPIPNILKELNE